MSTRLLRELATAFYFMLQLNTRTICATVSRASSITSETQRVTTSTKCWFFGMPDSEPAKPGENAEAADTPDESSPTQENDTAAEEGEPCQWGVTPPISLRLPTDADLQKTTEVEGCMRQLGLYESEEGYARRSEALRRLEELQTEWLRELGVERGLTLKEAMQVAGRIFTFGSYKLGVVTPGGDIDLLVVSSDYVTRENFFTYFLAKLQQDPHVEKLTPVPDAYTPIIKMCFYGVDMDVLFARVAIPGLVNLDLNDNRLLYNADDKTIRSLNGCRVAERILKLVPNVQEFKTTLRFIKYWATVRGVYSNVLGYLGGVSWAILAARICQLYPYFTASQLINRFFLIYPQWSWRRRPIMLCPVEQPPANKVALAQFRVWDPKRNIHDRSHKMPILTPAFPSMNSTHNVTDTTMRVLQEELSRGAGIVKEIEEGTKAWNDMVEPYDLFTSHKNFLQMDILADSEQIFERWSGWVESKLRLLIRKFEVIDGLEVRPNARKYAYEDPRYDCSCAIFFGLDVSQKSVDLRPHIREFFDILHSWPEGQHYADKFAFEMKHVIRQELPTWVKQDTSQTADRRDVELSKLSQLRKRSLEATLPPEKRAKASNGSLEIAVTLLNAKDIKK